MENNASKFTHFIPHSSSLSYIIVFRYCLTTDWHLLFPEISVFMSVRLLTLNLHMYVHPSIFFVEISESFHIIYPFHLNGMFPQYNHVIPNQLFLPARFLYLINTQYVYYSTLNFKIQA